MTERWTTRQAAEYWGCSPETYRGYVHQGYAPPALKERDPETGAKLYDAERVRRWKANRPGQGARTDLKRSHPMKTLNGH